MVEPAARPRWLRRTLTLLGIVLLAVNLRGPISAVGPVLDPLTDGLALSALEVSLLMAAPVVCFGIFGVLTPRLVYRLGLDATAAGVVAILAAALLVRSAGNTLWLFVGTVVVSAAIAVGNVLLPVLVKRDTPRHPGLMTGAYTTTLTTSAAIGAATAVPISSAYGWRVGLGVWVIPAVLAFIVWAPRIGGSRRLQRETPEPPGGIASLLREPLAWQVTAFFALQSAIFYAVLAWLPSIYRGAGIDANDAGLLLAVVTMSGIPMALVIPGWSARSADQRIFPVVLSVIALAGFTGLLIAPASVPVLWSVLLGLGLGGNFPLVLTLMVLRTATPRGTSSLSTMSQGLGYLISAAIGPLAIGLMHDISGDWTLPVAFLAFLTLPQAVTGWASGRALVIGERDVAGG